MIYAVRLLGFLLFSISLGMAVQVNLAAWRLRNKPAGPPRMVPWHVTAVTCWVFGSYSWNASEVVSRIGQDLTWRAYVFVVLGVLAVTSLTIISRVQQARKRAQILIETDDMASVCQDVRSVDDSS